MIHLLLALGLLLQGIAVRPSEGATVTGTVRTTDGKPAVGIRVAARARPDSLDEALEGASLAGIAETDASGRYRLEDVPPGRYTISAGRVDLPTYYPGTLDLSSGAVLAITPGSTLSGIDFTLADISFAVAGVASAGGVAPQSTVTIPLRITVDGGRKVPVFADGNFVRLVVDSGNGIPITSSLDVPSIALPFPVVPREYRVTVENLPAGYALKSITYGSRNLMTNALRLSAADLPLPTGVLGAITAAAAAGNLVVSAPSAKSASDLSATLSSTPTPPSTRGVRVAGLAPNAGVRSIYLSDKPGALYSDGTFEFRGVAPGKYVVMTSDNPPSSSPLGASVVVGDRDIDGVKLEPVPVLPKATPVAVEENMHTPGTVIPLAGLHGRLVSETTQQPLGGVLNVMGASTQVAYPIGSDGRFEIPRLLPGSYVLQISVFDYFTLNETVVVGEKDVSVELRARRVY